MYRKIVSRGKYYSNIIFPILSFLLCTFISSIDSNGDIFNLNTEKISTLVNISASFIGVLLTILTIYLAVPKDETKIKQLRDSYHEHIYLMNILTGIIIFFIATIFWIFFDNTSMSSIAFVSGIPNIIISIYYTFLLIKLL